jgi:DNA primase
VSLTERTVNPEVFYILGTDMNIKDLVEEVGYKPNRKAACHGGEYASPCPFCKDGDDRFLIWPQRHNKNGDYRGGRYSCRVCGKYGDSITFLRSLYDMKYLDACCKLKPDSKKIPSIPVQIKQSKLLAVKDPPSTWMKKATLFVEWCHLRLLDTPEVLSKVLARGFTLETIVQYKLGFNPGDANGHGFFRGRQDWGLEKELKEDGTEKGLWLPVGLVIPTLIADQQVIKIKIRNINYEDEVVTYNNKLMEKKKQWKSQKYIAVSGSKECPSIYGDSKNLSRALVIESELDAQMELFV